MLSACLNGLLHRDSSCMTGWKWIYFGRSDRFKYKAVAVLVFVEKWACCSKTPNIDLIWDHLLTVQCLG